MNKYEVRVTQTHVDYYHIEAKDEDEARALVRQHAIEGDVFIDAKKVDTIKRSPIVDYALQLTQTGEVTYDNL